MSSDDDLPVILVSAADVAAASSMIVELMSESSSPPRTNGVGGHEEEEEPREVGEEERGGGLVWRLANKYYTASVRLQPCADRPARAAHPADVQAHLIYLTEEECGDESACVRRAEAARALLARGAVRLVAARAAAPAAALAAWARGARYELVPLLPAPEPEPEPEREPAEPEPAGTARLREALHAHVWPGLVRRAAAPAVDLPAGSSSESSSDGEAWGAWRRAGAGGGAAARSAEFVAALALVPAALDRAPAAGLGDAARRLNAEQLIEIFCRALEDDLPLQEDGER